MKLDNIKRKTPAELLGYIAKSLEMTTEQLREQSRERELAKKRFVCMFLLHLNFTQLSYKKIAIMLNLTHHTSVIHGIKRARWLINKKDKSFCDTYNGVCRYLAAVLRENEPEKLIA